MHPQSELLSEQPSEATTTAAIPTNSSRSPQTHQPTLKQGPAHMLKSQDRVETAISSHHIHRPIHHATAHPVCATHFDLWATPTRTDTTYQKPDCLPYVLQLVPRCPSILQKTHAHQITQTAQFTRARPTLHESTKQIACKHIQTEKPYSTANRRSLYCSRK